MTSLRQLAFVAFAIFGTSVACADVIFEFERISDTEANVTATGFLPTADELAIPDRLNVHILMFQNPYGIAPTGLENSDVFVSSTMVIGLIEINSAAVLGTELDIIGGGSGKPWLYVFDYRSTARLPSESITGELSLRLPDGLSFASVGSSGSVNWGYADGTQPGYEGPTVGSWRIVATTVPEPSTLALFSIGLLGIALARRRKRA